MSVVGIDFGNLSALLAQAAKGGVDCILNDASNRQTATYVSVQGKQRYIGDAGAALQRSNIKNTVSCMKLLVGRKYEEEDVQTELKRHAFKHQKMPHGGVGICMMYNDEEIVVSAEHVLAMMLVKLKSIAAAANSNVKIGEAVLAVPSWFTDAQRRGVDTACRIAELNCLKVANESTTIALGYGIYKSAKKLFSETEAQHVMFVDLGYSCYSVSIVDFIQEKLIVRATVCDHTMGGRQFDDVIVEHLAEVFETKYKINVRNNAKAMLKLQVAGEKAKKLLSPQGVTEAPANVECLAEDIDLNVLLSKEEFETKSKFLIDKLAGPVNRCLSEAGLTKEEITDCEIVGGTSRIGILKKTLAEVLGLDTNAVNNGLKTTMNSDEAVCRGAALQCAMLSSKIKVKPFYIVDKVPYPIHLYFDDANGATIKAESKNGDDDDIDDDSNTASSSGGNNNNSVELYAKGDDYPRGSKKITFKDKTCDFKLTFAYPESATELLPPGQEKHIATYTIKVPSGKPPAKVVVTMNLDRNGCVYVVNAVIMEPIVEVEKTTTTSSEEKKSEEEKKTEEKDSKEASNDDAANAEEKAKTSGEEKKDGVEPPAPPKKRFTKVPLQIERESFGLDEKAVRDALELEASMANEDRLITETADKRNELESYIYTMRDKLIGEYKKFASDEEVTTLNSGLQETEDWLYGDGFDSVKSEYKKKLDDLKVTGDKIEFRSIESEKRADAIEGLKKQIEMCKTFASNRDEMYSHITDDERGRVTAEVKSAEDWIYEMLGKQADLPDCADPVLTCASIQSKRNSLFTVTNPIMTKRKPKPEPKPVPPQEGKDEDGKQSEGKEGSGEEKKSEEGKNDGEDKNDDSTPMAEDAATPATDDENKSGDAMEQ